MIYQIWLPIVIGELEWCLMTQNIINYLTIIILSILFPIARWGTIEMPSNHHRRPLNAHPALVKTSVTNGRINYRKGIQTNRNKLEETILWTIETEQETKWIKTTRKYVSHKNTIYIFFYNGLIT